MASNLIQIKASGLICSFCTVSIETVLKRYLGGNSVLVNVVQLAARSSIDTEVSL